MNSLVQVTDGQIVVESRKIAEHFDKQHKHVLDAIENIKAENSADPYVLRDNLHSRNG